jgi:hypothetical protein
MYKWPHMFLPEAEIQTALFIFNNFNFHYLLLRTSELPLR